MKWKKYIERLAQFPHLADDLTWRGRRNDNREFIRTKVGFIAPRPFENLDLSATLSSTGTSLSSDYVHARLRCYKATEYQISFRIEGMNDVTYLRHVDPGVGDGSIQAHIDDLTKWFKGCEAFRGKHLIWERVVKRTVSGSSYAGLTEMNLEIYLFPEFSYVKHPLCATAPPVTQKDLDSQATAHAYVRGEPMPPLVPA
jgi:hypothetical protein